MRILFLFGLAFASAAGAQTPVCAWSGSALLCPGRPAPSNLIAPMPLPGAIPTPEQRIHRLQAQADFDRELASARIEQAKQPATASGLTNALRAELCTGGETVVRDSKQGDLTGLNPRCAAAHK
jgi:hypothetical protein